MNLQWHESLLKVAAIRGSARISDNKCVIYCDVPPMMGGGSAGKSAGASGVSLWGIFGRSFLGKTLGALVCGDP